MKAKKKTLAVILVLGGIVGMYLILNAYIVLDRTDQELGIYEFLELDADAELVVEGTGTHDIHGELVSTKLKIIRVNWNKSGQDFVEGQVIEAKEYLVVYKNRQVSEIGFIPGRSLYGMGTSYKSITEGEQRTIHVSVRKAENMIRVLPEELVKKK
ncbi:hypothetical protein WMW72_07270 [Paenibacillus filicis]|uniref:Uncharacterized protein n=1 Tax=Paenibacillus filicis TaxID=669464 RepID=A0ABU9DFR4_9BACL